MRRALYKPPNLGRRDGQQTSLRTCVNGWMLRAEVCTAWEVGAVAGRVTSWTAIQQKPPGISGLGQPSSTVLCCGLEPDIYPPTLEAATEDCSLRDWDQGSCAAVLLGLDISWNALRAGLHNTLWSSDT